MTLLQKINDSLYIRIAGRFQDNKVRNVRELLIWCTLGMGEMVCMIDCIKKYPNAVLVVHNREYIVDFLREFLPDNRYMFVDDITNSKEDVAGVYDAVIFPAWAMRKKDIKAMIRLNIPLRIGQVWIKQRKYEYVFNRILYVDNYINEKDSYNQLFRFYENCISPVQ